MAEVNVSVVTVTFNAGSFIGTFLESLRTLDVEDVNLEVILVDNGSVDDTLSIVESEYSEVKVIRNVENNYCRALNLAIARSSGCYVAIVNNDATLAVGWLQGLLQVISTDERIGAVQSKIFFSESKLINSAGVEEIEHFYFRDIGFKEEDSPRYAKAAQRHYLTGGSVMFRRECLNDVGPWDEEYIMYMEDVDYSTRCRAKGWKLWFSPYSIVYHHFHGSSTEDICDYFCTRNRFFFVATHYPLELAACIPSSHFYQKGQFDLLYRALLHAVRRIFCHHNDQMVRKVFVELRKSLPHYIGDVATRNIFSHLGLLLGQRRIRVGIYDHAGHFAGGGQRYVAEMAAIMQDRYDITYIFNNDVELSEYQEWFDIDLSRCEMKLIRIPFFDKRNRYTPDEGMVGEHINNPFDIIAQESLNYDVFINANMLSKVNPLSPVSIFICHFPDQDRGRFFHVDKYDYLVVNGDYTGGWVERRWKLQPSHKIYPPINMYNDVSTPYEKENVILSVARFEVGGSKKQLELVHAFTDMQLRNPQCCEGWRLVLLGGSTPDNSYLETVRAAVAASNCDIEIKVNATVAEIRDHYRRAAIFWHACGLEETEPHRIEHFGMATVEAMQNYCLPIVIDGGGQREIVEHGDSGYRFTSLEELVEYSFEVMVDTARRVQMACRAFERSRNFDKRVFKAGLKSLLAEVEAELLGYDALPGGHATLQEPVPPDL